MGCQRKTLNCPENFIVSAIAVCRNEVKEFFYEKQNKPTSICQVHCCRGSCRSGGDNAIGVYGRILFRNHRTFIESFYKDDVKFGLACNFKTWMQQRQANSQLNGFKYAPLIEIYASHFGMENIKVVLFEELFKKEATANIFTDMQVDTEGFETVDVGKKSNEGYSLLSYYAARIVNTHFGTKANGRPGRMYRMYRKNISRYL